MFLLKIIPMSKGYVRATWVPHPGTYMEIILMEGISNPHPLLVIQCLPCDMLDVVLIGLEIWDCIGIGTFLFDV